MLFTYSTRRGVIIGNDGAIYLAAAKSIVAGTGYTASVPPASPRAVTHFPPLFSLAIAGASRLTGDVESGLRGLLGLCFAGTVFLAACVVYYAAGKALWPAILAGVLVATHPDILNVHVHSYSEPLYFVLSLGALALLLRYAAEGDWRPLAGACVLAGLCTLTRYSGLVVVATCVVLASVLRRGTFRERLGRAGWTAALALALPLILVLRNAATAGSAANRSIDLHWVSGAHFSEASTTLASWFLPVRFALGPAGGLAAIAVTAILAASFLWGWRVLAEGRSEMYLPAAFSFLSGTYVLLYFAHLAAAISFLHFNTPVDLRIASPVLLAALLLIPVALSRLHGRWWTLAFAGVLAVAAFNASRTAIAARHYANERQGITGDYWKAHPLIRAVRELPDGGEVWTYHQWLLHLNTQRPMLALPGKRSRFTTGADPGSAAALQAIGASARNTPQYIAYIKPPPAAANYAAEGSLSAVDLERFHEWTIGELAAALPLRILMETRDTVLFQVQAAR